MKLLIAALLLAVAGSGKSQEIRLEIGFVLPEAYVAQRYKDFGVILFDETKEHPGYSCPWISARISGISYIIAYKGSSREITYIHSSDANFETEDDLKTGDCINVTEDRMVENAASELRGPKTRDGWYPVLSIESYSRIKAGKRECMLITGFAKGGL